MKIFRFGEPIIVASIMEYLHGKSSLHLSIAWSEVTLIDG
jgi:hypothetical protein